MAERKPARLEEYRPVRRRLGDDDAPAGEEDAGQEAGQEYGAEDAEYADGSLDRASADAQPDVLLDVPALKVEEIHLEVDDLDARISLEADVLSLLKLHVGADVSLGSVSLDIKGVDAVAQLKVRLDQVAWIIDRVMTTIDDNPQILTDLTRASGTAVSEVGQGAEEAADQVGEGAGSAIESVGDGVEEAADDLGQATGRAVDDVVPSSPSEDRPRRVRRQEPRAAASPRGQDREVRRVRRPRPE